MTIPLLATKLYVPPVPAELVSRPRLIERLDAGLSRKLILVSAPAGFGKTTLLCEWIQRRDRTTPPPHMAWLSLEQDDNDPTRFWTYLLAAFDILEAGGSQRALALLHAPQPPPIEAVLTTLINDIASMPGTDTSAPPPFVLVLDDYHTIEAQPIHRGLAFLLDHLPPQVRLVISGRADPPLPLARLRARNQLLELRIDDLRFAPDETMAFLNVAMGLGLPARAVATLEARTEGWIAGLQLAALSLRGRDKQQIARFIETFSGSHRYILDYLGEEVLHQQPQDVQAFLLQTSILSRLSGPLCDAVTEGDSGQAMLEKLEAANLFVISLDDERHWYRYHPLFADLLHAHLQEQAPTAALHRRAAAWYERNGLATEAIGHALAAGDFARAARLIERSGEEMLWMRGEVATLLRWLEMLPQDLVRSRPGLCLLSGWVLFLGAQLDAVEARVQDAKRALEAAALPDDAPQRQSIVGQIGVMRAMLANFRGDIPRTIELSHQALDLLPDDNLLLRAALASNLGGAYANSGDALAASQAFTEATRLYQQTGNTFPTLLASSYVGNMQVVLGQLHQAVATYRQTLKLATEQGGPPSIGTRLAHIGLGRLLCEQNDLEAAKRHLLPSLKAAEQYGDEGLGPGPQLLLDGYLALARVYQAEGDARGALEAIHRARQVATSHAPHQLGQVAAVQARLWFVQDDLEAAGRWVRECGLHASDRADPLREFEYFTMARVFIAQNRLHDALGLLERLRQVADTAQRIGSVIEALMLQSLALHARGETGQAIAVLEQALLLAEPEGYVRLFLDEGPPLADLLHQAAAHGIAMDYVNNLLAAFETADSSPQAEPPPPPAVPAPSPLIEPLTPRELEVLHLIAGGLSNREITRELYIAETTVKKHASNIFGKLGVNSRTQAVARARELGLL